MLKLNSAVEATTYFIDNGRYVVPAEEYEFLLDKIKVLQDKLDEFTNLAKKILGEEDEKEIHNS